MDKSITPTYEPKSTGPSRISVPPLELLSIDERPNKDWKVRSRMQNGKVLYMETPTQAIVDALQKTPELEDAEEKATAKFRREWEEANGYCLQEVAPVDVRNEGLLMRLKAIEGRIAAMTIDSSAPLKRYKDKLRKKRRRLLKQLASRTS